jgi:hypothetical protein
MVWQPEDPPPREKGSRKIQLPYINKFETIWEYEKAFLSDRIDFFSYIGPTCPLCGTLHCYRQITPYWRYAIDLFPCFKKKRITIARFVCRRGQGTFSLLPIQLIPYFQYTVVAVIGTLLLGFGMWQRGQCGFFGASVEVDQDSLVTPYLIVYWLVVVLRGFRRAHETLRSFYDLSVKTSQKVVLWHEFAYYFQALGITAKMRWGPLLHDVLYRYSHATRQFLFGTPSQYRGTMIRP